MTSALRDAILAALVEPRTRDELAAITATAKPAVCEAVSILIKRGAVREVGPDPIRRLELVASPRPPLLEQLRALAPDDRATVLEASGAVAESLAAELEAARRGDQRPINLHTCDVLGIATALIVALEELAARDQPPAPVAPELDDAEIRRVRDEARFGRLDRDVCRARLAELLRTTRYPTASKDPTP